jgi:sigma-54 dependent transcriptional regulator, acetoin dehydrogenase operon transcriptional activator AcoR
VASQLFGHKKGAFTGAISDHKGVFEAAEEGTVFLDEIGEIPLNIQSNLLRVLENREISRVGEATTRKVNVRIISATNRDLVAMAEEGTFRKDLLYRLRVARICLPTLRERREDIPMLIDRFLVQMRSTIGKSISTVADEACGLLMAYSWPGNIRELRNAIEFAVIRCRTGRIECSDLPPEITEGSDIGAGDRSGPVRDERAEMERALEQTRGNRSRAAKILGWSRATFYRRLAEFEQK